MENEPMRLGEAKTPDNTRLYAIGDVHGCDALLADAHARIERDLAERPIADHRIVHIGDYVDRGPEVAAAVDRLVRLKEKDQRALFLLGNHERMLLDFLADPVHGGPVFLDNGGYATLRSYRVPVSRWSWSGKDLVVTADRFVELMPQSHRDFFETLDLSARFGDFFFCHAGVRPGVPLDEQDPHDLVWIRDEFLLYGREFDAVIVHGHTPAEAPEVRSNRINIDTGAVFTRNLSCLALEGTEYRFL